MEAIKPYNRYSFGDIREHVDRKKPRKDTSEDISDGKPIEHPEGIVLVIETERTGKHMSFRAPNWRPWNV